MQEAWAELSLTFPKVGSNCIDLCLISDEAHPSLFKPVYATFSGAQVTVSEVSICQRSLLGGIARAEGHVTGNIVVKKEWRSEMKRTSECFWSFV
jgi:hypothetical protein